MSEFDVVKGLLSIYSRINAVCLKNSLEIKPKLVAVSKTKPKEMVIKCYEQGQRDFGENYIQELVEKSTDPEILQKCQDIRWHFIGSIQRNKVNKLASVPGLYLVHTIDSEKLAQALNTAWEKHHRDDPLRIMIQVNTSGEEVKGGTEPQKTGTLVKYVLDSCPSLRCVGLMTIGRFDHDLASGPNPDFLCLKKCRDDVCNELELGDMELSMGMSNDFEHAIELGSSYVRVGSSIFGVRSKKN